MLCCLFFVATTFEQIRHTGLSVLMGSPCSFGLKPKYSHTGAVAFGFRIIFLLRVAPHEAHLLNSVCIQWPSLPPQRQRDWMTDKRVHSVYSAMEQTHPGAETEHRVNPLVIQPAWSRETRKTNTHAHGNISRLAK